MRLRLTLLYGGLFLISGAVLLATTYVLVEHATGNLFLLGTNTGRVVIQHAPNAQPHEPTFARGTVSPQVQAQIHHLYTQAVHQHAADAHQLLVQSGIALAIMALVSIGLGWLVAGRALRPLRRMTVTARRISEHNLHERLAIRGPRDEVRDLADTVDGLLGRLETAFDAQRRFVANASHELRTPLTLERALLEVALANPHATVESLRSACERVLATEDELEQLIDSLLTLATSERGLDAREPLDLALVTDGELVKRRVEAEARGLQVNATFTYAPTLGSPRLLQRLVANLIDNAMIHNVTGGWIEIITGATSGRAILSITNSGPEVPPDEVERLFQPFQRLDDGACQNDGHGLGLAIIRAIADAHGADIVARAQPDGGLKVTVRFPIVAVQLAPSKASEVTKCQPEERVRAATHRGCTAAAFDSDDD